MSDFDGMKERGGGAADEKVLVDWAWITYALVHESRVMMRWAKSTDWERDSKRAYRV